MMVPGFRSLRICADLQDSAKIVALNLENSYRSAISLQKCADFLQRFLQKCVFLQLLRNQYTAFVLLQLLIEYFSWHRVGQLKLSITQNSGEGKFFPITVNLVTGESAVLVIHRNLSIPLELSRTGCWALRGSIAILTSFWQIKFDTWQPSGLINVLIKCCCYNISAT